MIHSMTAYANLSLVTAVGLINWEVRSTNHRYLELTFKLPEVLRELEWDCRELFRRSIVRGKVECLLKFEPNQTEQALKVDFLQVDRLIGACLQIIERLPNQIHNPISPIEILKMPSVLSASEIKVSEVSLAIQNVLKEVLKNVLENRAREGEAIQKLLQERLLKMKNGVQEIYHRFPLIQKNYREKLKTKLNDLKTQIDENRFEQEVIYWLQKIDISEELDRISIHLSEVQRILESGGVVGRRLDFLMQELNREANTLVSKALDTETINIGVTFKVIIEEMREQIQNLE
jgi:uncharacterized protein (TIGR00255 family)